MKTIQRDEWRVISDEMHAVGGERSRHQSPVTFCLSAFTLVELLTVIAVIAIIAALIFPVARTVKRQTIIHSAQAQMAQIQTALERYKSVYGFYPPASAWALTNQLYYELEGTVRTNVGGADYYETLDHSVRTPVAVLASAFGAGVGGFMNCNKPGADEAAARAENFLTELNTNQFSPLGLNNNMAVTVLVTPVGGPDAGYNPVYNPLATAYNNNSDVNPWRYNYPGTNNPGSYDLWIQLDIAGKTNLVCNWTKTVEINNNTLP
jgi:prepilin-type N-terminal cleavage/methylation domain-containing protein